MKGNKMEIGMTVRLSGKFANQKAPLYTIAEIDKMQQGARLTYLSENGTLCNASWLHCSLFTPKKEIIP